MPQVLDFPTAALSIGDHMNIPYNDTKFDDGSFLRIFDASNSTEDEYVWHRDRHDRVVEVLQSGDGSNEWEFQFEDSLPESIIEGQTIKIRKELYHRLIKGSGTLILKITEFP